LEKLDKTQTKDFIAVDYVRHTFLSRKQPLKLFWFQGLLNFFKLSKMIFFNGADDRFLGHYLKVGLQSLLDNLRF
jgi:hypothetical protein